MFNNYQKKFYPVVSMILIFAFMIGCFSGCSSNPKPIDEPEVQSELSKVADHLYETTFTTDFDWSLEVIPTSVEDSAAACAGIQNGQYRGRNYDWYYNDTDLCVIHAAATEDREHASVGIADLSFITDENGEFDYEKIPFVTVDGINDVGICVQVNVMPAGENGELIHSATTDDDIPDTHVVRYLLDYADSIDEVIALLKEKDITTTFSSNELHWMISGPSSNGDDNIETVVIEMFPDGMRITGDFVNDMPIMTNFNVANFDGSPDSVGWGLGYERWQILCENYDQANSVMGTFDLMEKVFFSKMYDLYGDRFWYSEYALTNLCNYYSESELIDILGEDTYRYYMDNYGAVYYTPEMWDGETTIYGDISKTGTIAPVVEKANELYCAQEKDGNLWITVETAVYDLENLTLDVAVRESQDHYHFTIG